MTNSHLGNKGVHRAHITHRKARGKVRERILIRCGCGCSKRLEIFPGESDVLGSDDTIEVGNIVMLNGQFMEIAGKILKSIVGIRKKSKLQRDNCLFCSSIATLEAFGSIGKSGAAIRCCNNETCIRSAKAVALDYLQKKL